MYSFNVSIKAERLIRKCLNIIKSLNLPIASTIRFIDITGNNTYGCCIYNGKKDFFEYTIGINKFIISDKDYEDAVIHELIHTIKCCNKAHNDEWNKYAADVRMKSNYLLYTFDNKELGMGAYLI